MTRFAILPLLLAVGACSAEVEKSEAELANQGETLTVENVVIVHNDVAPVESGIVTQDPVRATTAGPAAPAAGPAARAAPAPDPKPSAKAAPKPSEADSKPPAPTCTAEHREMGHC